MDTKLILYSLLAMFRLTCLPHLVFAGGFVATRTVDSYIHCTRNVVMRRFYAYLTSWIFLLCTWLMLAWQLLAG